ncbi:DUF6020 family protein [Streptomyces sp. NRRL F-5123]|uniref:DUF6020 family protein n=1 Tax=Streptomyces sp. NRRL F-5123 TaxID=1463856 RepID=UPI0004E2807C|nr:DUF6020 family protein [Streptomyces sp. NRRL F-5123]
MTAPALRRVAAPLRRIPPRLRLPVAVYAGCQAVLLLWWAAFYPARTSADSVTYTYEVTDGPWRSDHSVAYDALDWLSLHLTGGVAALTLLQTAATAAALGYVCHALRALGVRGRWSAPAALLVVLLPSSGSFVVYVWKDVAFAVATLVAFGALTSLTARRLRAEGPLPADRGLRRDTLVLAAGFLGIGLFRNNGFPVLLCAGVLLVPLLRGMRRRLALATAVPLVVTLLLNGVVYSALGVQKPRADEAYAFNYADIGVAYGERPDTFTPADLALMREVAPLSHWAGPGADCHEADALMRKPMDRLKAGRINDQLMDLWFRVLKRTPGLVVHARLCRADIAWKPFGTHTGLYAASPVKALDKWRAAGHDSARSVPYGDNLYPRPLSYRLHHLAVGLLHRSERHYVQPAVWRGVNWTYLGYLIVLLAAVRRRRPVLLALAALPVGLQLTVLVANPSPLWRYMSASLILGVLTLPVAALAFAPRPEGGAGTRAAPPDQPAAAPEEATAARSSST